VVARSNGCAHFPRAGGAARTLRSVSRLPGVANDRRRARAPDPSLGGADRRNRRVTHGVARLASVAAAVAGDGKATHRRGRDVLSPASTSSDWKGSCRVARIAVLIGATFTNDGAFGKWQNRIGSRRRLRPRRA